MKRFALIAMFCLFARPIFAIDQVSDEEAYDKQLELMQRHIEALEEQNRLLKTQLEQSNVTDSTSIEPSSQQQITSDIESSVHTQNSQHVTTEPSTTTQIQRTPHAEIIEKTKTPISFSEKT